VDIQGTQVIQVLQDIVDILDIQVTLDIQE
jgi:hypothetical protein